MPSEISITHSALKPRVLISDVNPDDILDAMEKQLADRAKVVLRKYLNGCKRSGGDFSALGEESCLRQSKALFLYLNHVTKLKTLQKTISPLVPELKSLLPGKKSRYFKQQKSKMDFLEALSSLDIEEVEDVISWQAILEFESLSGNETSS